MSNPILPHYSWGYLPHISRVFSARIPSFVVRGGIALCICGLCAVNMLSISDSTSIDSDRSHILYTPYDVSSYMLYAKSLYENGLENEARKQVRIGKETVTSFPISFSPVFKSPEAVLGATTTLDDLEYSWNKKRGEAQKNYDYWKGIVKDKPDYRDGYIMLAFQTLSLQKYDEARVYIERALFIDPTNETAQKLKTTMSRKGI